MSKGIWIVALLVMAAGAVWGDGMIFPNPPRPDQPFTVSYHRVTCDIENQVAKTAIDQAFYNDTDRELEGTYIFPIPTDAALTNFSMMSGGKKLTGEVLDREEARRIYEGIVRAKRDPALLEYMDQGLFRARVFPLPPHQDKQIGLSYSQVLKQDSDLVKYVYPLSTERFSNRPIKEITITVNVDDKSPIGNVYSPTHDIAVHRHSDRSVTVSFEQSNTRPATDFVLYYSLTRDDIGLSLFTYKEGDDDGFFMLLASPKVDAPKDEVIPKDVVFVLDRTGSMAGEKLTQAKAAFRFCVNNLHGVDRFNVISFNSSPDDCFSEGMVTADAANIKKADGYVAKIESNGGTNINEAMLHALSLFSGRVAGQQRMKVIVFLTDGLATVGVTDVNTILGNVKSKNQDGVRTFVFGVGYDVNVQFLDKLAQGNRGYGEYVRPDEDIEVPVSNLYGKLANPMLTDIRIDFAGVKAKDWYPQDLPDLFRGSQIVILGRFEESGKGSVTLSGTSGRAKLDFQTNHTFNGDTEHDYIPRLWAARKIGYLLDQVRLNGTNKEVIDEIVHLSKQYGIITEYTSYLVNEDELRGIVRDRGGDYDKMMRDDYALNDLTNLSSLELNRTVTERVDQANMVSGGAYGVSQSQQAAKLKGGAGGANYNLKRSAKPTAPGMVPADLSNNGLNMDSLQQSVARGGEWVTIQNMQQIGNRTFYNRGGNWVDDRTPPNANAVKVKRYSDAYFQMASYNGEVARYLAVGENAIFVYNSNVIQVGDEGQSEKYSDAELIKILGKAQPVKTSSLHTGGEETAHGSSLPLYLSLGIVGLIGGGAMLRRR